MNDYDRIFIFLKQEYKPLKLGKKQSLSTGGLVFFCNFEKENRVGQFKAKNEEVYFLKEGIFYLAQKYASGFVFLQRVKKAIK